MSFGSKGFYTATFLLILIMMLTIGVNSGVSLSASLTRAIFAGGFFAALTWVIGKIILIYVFPPLPVVDLMLENETVDNETLGTKLDVTATDPLTHSEQQITEPASVEPNASDFFTPMSARQIDPQVNKIINSDPQKVAEIVRKMGFEEE